MPRAAARQQQGASRSFPPPPNRTLRPRLTPRENELVRLIAGGCSNVDIAGILGVSIYTVQVHRANIYNKLGIWRAADLIKYAVRMKLTSLRPMEQPEDAPAAPRKKRPKGAKTVKRILLEMGLSQTELARRLQIGLPQLNRVITGERKTPWIRAGLARELKMPVHKLFRQAPSKTG